MQRPAITVTGVSSQTIQLKRTSSRTGLKSQLEEGKEWLKRGGGKKEESQRERKKERITAVETIIMFLRFRPH